MRWVTAICYGRTLSDNLIFRIAAMQVRKLPSPRLIAGTCFAVLSPHRRACHRDFSQPKSLTERDASRGVDAHRLDSRDERRNEGGGCAGLLSDLRGATRCRSAWSLDDVACCRGAWHRHGCPPSTIARRTAGSARRTAPRFSLQPIFTAAFEAMDFSAASASFSATSPSLMEGEGATLFSMLSMKAVISAA